MQLTSLLQIAVLAPMMVTPAVAGCFGRFGVTWSGDREKAMEAAKSFCESKESIGGYFNPGDNHARCINLGRNKKANFSIHFVGKQGTTLQQKHCIEGLQQEIRGCGAGGSRNTADWIYTSDPNSGQC